MRSLQWTPARAVQVPAIDAEHQEMFRLAADLRQALLAGEKTGRLELHRRRLAAVVTRHLAHEERLMRDAGYPAYAWHERQHRTGRSKLGILERDVQRGEPRPMFEALEALAGWMRDHTAVADRIAASYLRNYWRERA